jgi:two-component system response regulator NreC
VIRIVLVDDHALVRSGLKRLLEAQGDLEVVGEAGDIQEAVFEVRAAQPDIVLLDLMMPGETGIAGLPKLLEEAPGAKVVILSMEDEPTLVRQAFAAGASGYVLKNAVDSELVAAVRDVAGGNRYVHPALGAQLLAAEAAALAVGASDDPLSDREREVLRLLALGHTNQEIAAQLFISVRTAETHRSHVMQKLQFSTRAELVRYAIEHGMLEPD